VGALLVDSITYLQRNGSFEPEIEEKQLREHNEEPQREELKLLSAMFDATWKHIYMRARKRAREDGKR
jgi:hypothetical protein